MGYYDTIEKEDAVNGLIYRVRNEMLETYPESEYNIDVILSGLRISLLKKIEEAEFKDFMDHLQKCTGCDYDIGYDMAITIKEDFHRRLYWNNGSLVILSIMIGFDDGQDTPDTAYELRVDMFPCSDFDFQTVKEYMECQDNQFVLVPDNWDIETLDFEDVWFDVHIFDMSKPHMTLNIDITTKEKTDKRIQNMKVAIQNCTLKKFDEEGY